MKRVGTPMTNVTLNVFPHWEYLVRTESAEEGPEMKNHPEIGGKCVVLLPYNNASKGAKVISKNLGLSWTKRQYQELQFAELRECNWKVLNWGCTNNIATPTNSTIEIFNNPVSVRHASDKLKFYDTVKNKCRVPDFTSNLDTVTEWREQGKEVMGRSLRGTKGRGIVFPEDDFEDFVTSDFWVVYKKKKDEFRVHVMKGEVIDIQQKALRVTDDEGNRIDTSSVDFRVRNLRNGFIFKRYDIDPPQDVLTQAVSAVTAIGLDFGAVDVIWNQTEGKAYVLEVNTAPGLEGTTIERYTTALKKHFLEGKEFDPPKKKPTSDAFTPPPTQESPW